MSAEETAQLVVLTQTVAKLATEIGALKVAVAAQAVRPAGRDALDIAGVRKLTGHRSDTAARRWLKANKVRPYAPGRWFEDAVQSAKARRSFADLRATKRAAGGVA